MTGCLYLSTNWAKAAVSPCLTRSIRAASGSCSAGISFAKLTKHQKGEKGAKVQTSNFKPVKCKQQTRSFKLQGSRKRQTSKCKIQHPKSKVQSPKSKVQSPKSKVQSPKSKLQGRVQGFKLQTNGDGSCRPLAGAS